MIDSAARLGTPASHSRIGGTIRPSSKTLVAWEGIEPGTAPPMSSWWPKACTNATTRRPRLEDRHGDAQVGQVADAALGAVDVVVEEDVARAHLLDREVADDRVHERGVRAAGELAQQPVVDAGPEVVGVADHRAAAGAADRGLDLHLDRGQRALDDLDQHRVGARAGVGGQRGRTGTAVRRPAAARLDGVGVPRRGSRSRLTYSSTRAVKPGCSGTVEPNSSMIAGPGRRPSPGGQVGAPDDRGVDVPGRRRRSRPAGVPVGRRWRARRRSGPTEPLISGRRIGPMPETRRFTHSTCWRGVAGEVVAVERAVLGVEARRRPRRARPRRPAPSRHGDPHLEGLPEVAQVGGAERTRAARRRTPRGPAPRRPGPSSVVVDRRRPRPGRARRRARRGSARSRS